MVWQPKISEFVPNCLVELVQSGVCFNIGFKEAHIKKVVVDVLAFAGIHVSTIQVYNHIRKWRTKCSVISKIKSDRTLEWSEDGYCLYLDDEEMMHEYMKVISFIEFLHRSTSMPLSSALILVPFELQRYM
jgi:hypothetical protein